MRDRNWLAILLVCIVIGLILIPKDIEFETSESFGVCKCIGIKSQENCLGKKFACVTIKTNDLDDSEEIGSGNSNILIVIDVSSSMQGDKFIHAKRSAVQLIEEMQDGDRIGIITFAQHSQILQPLTADQDELLASLEGISSARPKEKTNYKAAVEKALDIFESARSGINKVVFLGDGNFEENIDTSGTYAAMEKLLEKRACIYSLGYNLDRTKENILKNFADMSGRVGECGRYFYATDPAVTVSDVANNIYQDTSSVELEIDIKSPVTQSYQERLIGVNFSTNVDAICSYSLNRANKKRVPSENFEIEGDFGKNTLQIFCRRENKNAWEDEQKVNFFIEGEKGIFESISDFFKKESTVEAPSKDEVKSTLREIFEKERLSVIRELQPRGEGTVVTLIIQNTKPLHLENVRINQVIPSFIVDDVSKLNTDERYSILDSNPFVMEFQRESIAPEEIVSISYYIEKPITREELGQISTEIRYDSPDEQQLESLFAMQNKSRQNFKIKRSDNYFNGKKGQIKLQPQYDMNDVNVYLNIPKCMAVDLNEVYFKDKDYKIIARDPLIGWHYDEVKDNITIDYEAQAKIEDYCANKISVITLAEEVKTEKKPERAKTKIEYLLPIIIVPVIIIIIFIYMQVPVRSSTRKSPILRYVLAITLIILLVWIIFPKEKITGEKRCSCFGIGYKTKCYGMPFSCTSLQGNQKIEKISNTELCQNPGCNNIKKYLNADPRLMNEVGIDLVLMLDQSKSMAGNKMSMAKQASTKLLSQMKEYDRISLITFDNSSRLAQEFSNDKNSIRNSIETVRVGYSTKYVPALTRTYYNFLSKGNKFNKWMVIFISDGEPDDEPEEIYEKIRQMANEGICVNAIGYGDEIKPGSKAEKIMKEMAKISKSTNGCGSYYYSPSSIDTLAQVLGRLYKQVYTEKAKLNVDATVNNLKLTSEEEFVAKANVYSSVNNLNIPGTFRMESQRYCVPKANVNLVLSGDGQSRKYAMKYRPTESSYVIRTKELPVGEFEVHVTAQVGYGGCLYKGNYSLGTLQIDKFEGFRKCSTESCHDIAKYLFEKKEKNVIKVLITDYAFIPQNVSIDKGTTVIWKNVGEKPHTVTSGSNYFDGFFNSGILMPGEQFNKTFKSSRNFQYFDNLSVRLKGYTHKKTDRDITFGNFKLEYKLPIDLVLVVDRSASMYGNKMDQLKKASHHLINMVYPGDRVGLVEFSDYASVGQTFTEDRELLKTKTDRMTPGGSTRYIPALEKAKELYQGRTEGKDNGKVVVFLSDGHPWDKGKPESIYNKAKELIEDGICIYTVGYGEEVYKGSEAERLLRRIVKMSQESGNCGQYNYAPAQEIRLVKIFGSIYHDAAGNVKGLQVLPKISENVFYDNESLEISAKIKSTFTNNYLPGSMNKSGERFCGPPANVQAIIKDRQNHTITKERLRYKGDNTGYFSKVSNLEPGDYNVEIEARSVGSSGKTCEFQGSEQRMITVLNSESLQISATFIVFFVLIIGFILYLIFKKGP